MATAHRREAAAHGLRLHALGPRTGGDGAAAGQPLQLPSRPLRWVCRAVDKGHRQPAEEHLDARQQQASAATASAPVGLGRVGG